MTSNETSTYSTCELLQSKQLLRALYKEILSLRDSIKLKRSYSTPNDLGYPKSIHYDTWLSEQHRRVSVFKEPNPSMIFFVRTVVEALSMGSLTEKEIKSKVVEICGSLGVKSTGRGSIAGLNVDVGTLCMVLAGLGVIQPDNDATSSLQFNGNLAELRKVYLGSADDREPTQYDNVGRVSSGASGSIIGSSDTTIHCDERLLPPPYSTPSILSTGGSSINTINGTSAASSLSFSHPSSSATRFLSSSNSSNIGNCTDALGKPVIHPLFQAESLYLCPGPGRDLYNAINGRWSERIVHFLRDSKVAYNVALAAAAKAQAAAAAAAALATTEEVMQSGVAVGSVPSLSLSFSSGDASSVVSATELTGLTLAGASSPLQTRKDIALKVESTNDGLSSHSMDSEEHALLNSRFSDHGIGDLEAAVEGEELLSTSAGSPRDGDQGLADVFEIRDALATEVGSSTDQALSGTPASDQLKKPSKYKKNITCIDYGHDLKDGVKVARRSSNQRAWRLGNPEILSAIERVDSLLENWSKACYRENSELELEESLLRKLAGQCGMTLRAENYRIGTKYLLGPMPEEGDIESDSIIGDALEAQMMDIDYASSAVESSTSLPTFTSSGANQLNYRDGAQFTASSLIDKAKRLRSKKLGQRRFSELIHSTSMNSLASSGVTPKEDSKPAKRQYFHSSQTGSVVGGRKRSNPLSLHNDYYYPIKMKMEGSIYATYIAPTSSSATSMTSNIVQPIPATIAKPDLLIRTCELPWSSISKEFVALEYEDFDGITTAAVSGSVSSAPSIGPIGMAYSPRLPRVSSSSDQKMNKVKSTDSLLESADGQVKKKYKTASKGSSPGSSTLPSVAKAVTVYAPSFREFRLDETGSEYGSEHEEDISDDAVMERHESVLQSMRDRWAMISRLKQECKDLASGVLPSVEQKPGWSSYPLASPSVGNSPFRNERVNCLDSPFSPVLSSSAASPRKRSASTLSRQSNSRKRGRPPKVASSAHFQRRSSSNLAESSITGAVAPVVKAETQQHLQATRASRVQIDTTGAESKMEGFSEGPIVLQTADSQSHEEVSVGGQIDLDEEEAHVSKRKRVEAVDDDEENLQRESSIQNKNNELALVGSTQEHAIDDSVQKDSSCFAEAKSNRGNVNATTENGSNVEKSLELSPRESIPVGDFSASALLLLDQQHHILANLVNSTDAKDA